MCYDIQNEVRNMENNEKITDEQRNEQTPQSGEGYKERPRYQVWMARVGLVVMIAAVVLYYYHIAKGGI